MRWLVSGCWSGRRDVNLLLLSATEPPDMRVHLLQLSATEQPDVRFNLLLPSAAEQPKVRFNLLLLSTTEQPDVLQRCFDAGTGSLVTRRSSSAFACVGPQKCAWRKYAFLPSVFLLLSVRRE